LVLVFCEIADLAALWVADRLKKRGVAVDIVSAPVLGSAMRWEHRLTSGGEATITVDLGDGRTLSNSTPVSVLNRLSFVPTGRLDTVAGPDREYAVQEMNALFLSWLNALPGPVVNRPTPQGLGGAWRHRSSWIALAGEVGLATVRYRQSCNDDPAAEWSATQQSLVTIFAVGDRVVAPPRTSSDVQAGCLRLARAARETLLGVDMAPDESGGLVVVNASTVPDLMRGGEPIIDALSEVLAA
jgi:hypothetical protein